MQENTENDNAEKLNCKENVYYVYDIINHRSVQWSLNKTRMTK